MNYQDIFRMPNPVKITGRSSSITNSFVNSIIPTVPPSEEQIAEALNILGMNRESFSCAYCGDFASEWDHLRPLVRNKRPTGYISEIHNLVPACGKCNQSKGNKDWKEWISGPAKLSPKSRGVKDLDYRIEKLSTFESWGRPTKMDFESIVGKARWQQHWDNCQELHEKMREAQELAAIINREVEFAFNNSREN